MQAAVLILALAGCYDARPQAGSPCPDGVCPTGLFCSAVTERCERSDEPADARDPDGAPPPPPDGQGLARCLTEDFDDENAAGWLFPEGSFAISETAGPDGSPALTATSMTSSVASHPAMWGVTEARVEVDFKIDQASSGDFFVRFYETGPWLTDPTLGRRYTASIFPIGSDDAVDRIALNEPPATAVVLASRPTTTEPSTWHRLVVIYGKDGSLAMQLDGAMYLMLAETPAIPPPLDLAIRYFGVGVFDNLVVDCAR